MALSLAKLFYEFSELQSRPGTEIRPFSAVSSGVRFSGLPPLRPSSVW